VFAGVGEGGPAMIGGAEENDGGRAEGGGEVTGTGVVGDEEFGPLDDGFE